jgi:hypothetical protein
MNGLNLNFRDYTSHFFPGCILLTAFLVGFDSVSITKISAPSLAIVVLIGGYIIGYLNWMVTDVLRKILQNFAKGNCLKDYCISRYLFLLESEDGFSKELKEEYDEVKLLIAPNAKNNYGALKFVFLRYIEVHEPELAEKVDRQNALSNLATSFIIPLSVLSVILFQENNLKLAFLATFLIFFIPSARRNYMGMFRKNIVRSARFVHEKQRNKSD